MEYPLTAAWRGLFAYVPQGNQLMSGTIREVVAFGDPDAMQQEGRLSQALKIACADEFVMTLEHGVDTRLGERGAGLSEGQMQRISIARAILRNTPILIPAEAPSAHDSESEAAVKTAIEKLMEGRTTFIVAHRLSTIRNASRIVVMGEGVVREIGTHESLLSKGGDYAHLCKLQQI